MKFFDFFRKKPAAEKAAPAPERIAIPKTTLPNGVELSPELSTVKNLFEKSAMPFLRIKAKPAADLSLTESKIGGLPYWPAGMPYPKSSEGAPLFHLAQLNFRQIPHLEGYPQKGILQFYIASGGAYGMDFDNPLSQQDFRVVYFEEVDEAGAEKDFSFLREAVFDDVPVYKSMRLQFSEEVDYGGSMDVRFEKTFGKEVLAFAERFGEKADDVADELFENFSSNGHKIGGYACFTQVDPREDRPEFRDWLLLLQIDSQDDDILWGDMGIANFFIHPEDLRKKDFSSVLYNWDCT